MNPVWIKFPDISLDSIGWRMGAGEEYWMEWVSWFNKLETLQKQSYILEWPEPKQWAGFYCFIEHGTLPSWMKNDDTLKLAAAPPEDDEILISDPLRIRGLMRYYFSPRIPNLRARDVDLDELYSDPMGFIWGAKFSEGTVTVARYSGYLIGSDNLEVKQPVI